MHILLIVGLLVFTLAIVFLAIKKPRFLAQAAASAAIVIAVLCCIAAAPASRDYVISTLSVWPAAAENGTNSVIFRNKGGTNWWGIEPTNAAVKMRWMGTNYTGISWTNILVTNAAASSGRTLVFKNGLLVEVGTNP
jgi:hypothetical protein